MSKIFDRIIEILNENNYNYSVSDSKLIKLKLSVARPEGKNSIRLGIGLRANEELKFIRFVSVVATDIDPADYDEVLEFINNFNTRYMIYGALGLSDSKENRIDIQMIHSVSMSRKEMSWFDIDEFEEILNYFGFVRLQMKEKIEEKGLYVKNEN